MAKNSYHLERSVRKILRQNVDDILSGNFSRKDIIENYKDFFGSYSGKYDTPYHRQKIYNKMEEIASSISQGENKYNRRVNNALEYREENQAEIVRENAKRRGLRNIPDLMELPESNNYWFLVTDYAESREQGMFYMDNNPKFRVEIPNEKPMNFPNLDMFVLGKTSINRNVAKAAEALGFYDYYSFYDTVNNTIIIRFR